MTITESLERESEQDERASSVEPQRSAGYRIYRASRFWVILAVIVAAALFTGLSAFSVKTGSMRPTYYPGDLVIAVNPNIVKPKVGSVVVATPKVAGEELPAIAHRVIAVEANGNYKTKGDYNPQPDAWQDSPRDIQKVVIAHVPMAWSRSPLVIAAGIGVIALIFLWPSDKKEDAEQESPMDEQLPISVS